MKFLFGGYLTGQAIGSSQSPLPAFDADAAVGPAQEGWQREIKRQDALGLPPMVVDTNPLDGTVVTHMPDGRSLEVHKDGTQILTHPDSGMAVIRPDKSGFLVLKDTDPVTGDTRTSTVILDPSTVVSFENKQWVTWHVVNSDSALIEQTTYQGNRTSTEDIRINRAADGKIVGLEKLSAIPFVSYLPADAQAIDDGLRSTQLTIRVSPDHTQLVTRDEDRRLVQTVDIKTIDRYRTERVFRDGEGNLQRTVITERINDSATRTRVLDSEGNDVETTVLHTYRHHGETLTLEDKLSADGTRTFTTRDKDNHVRKTEIAALDAKPAEIVEFVREQLHHDIADFLTALRQKDTAGMILSTARIALDYARSEGMVTAQLDGLVGDVSSGLALVNSLRSIRSGDTLAKIGGTVGLLNSTNYLAANHFGGAYLSGAQSAALSTAGAILSIASLAKLGDMLKAGQVGSAAATVVSALNAISYLSKGTSLMGAGALVPINPIAMVVAAYVLDQLFASDPPPPPPVGSAHFFRQADGQLAYRIENANPLGRSILQKRLDELLPKLESQIAAANAVITDPTHQLQLVASRMPVIHISSWPTYTDNGVSNFYFAIEQTDPMRDNPNWMGVSRLDLVEHYGETLLLPEALVQQWEVDHLRGKFGSDESHWQTESAWLRSKSPVEQERSRLQAVFEQAEEEWKALSAAKLVASELGQVVEDESHSGQQQTLEAQRQQARLQMESARATVDEFNASHPADPRLAARASAEEEAVFARTHAARDTVALQWTRLIAIDLAGDGIQIDDLPGEVGSDLDSITHQQVARFDVDGDGYREATQWVSPADALLGIDRSGNGVLDDGSELFNASDVPFDQHGLPSLAYVDANDDGLINRDDPVYQQLRLWVDLDGDGSSGSLEVFDMNLRPVGLPAEQLLDQPRSPMAIDAIDLKNHRVRFADGSSAGMHTVNLLSHVKGLQIVQDEATRNLNVLHEDGLRENFVTMVEDMSALTELQSANLSAVRRAELQALAKRYGLNPESAEFADIVRSLRSAAASTDAETVIYFGDEDVWVDPAFREQLAQMRIRFRRLGDGSAGSASVAGGDQLARFGTSLQTQAINNTSAFDDRWAESRRVSATDIQSDPVAPASESQSTSEQLALPSDVYSLLEITKGAQDGSVVTRQVIAVSDPARPEAPVSTISVYVTQQPVARLAPLELVMNEDATLKIGYVPLEQRAMALLGSAAGSVKLLGIRSSAHGTVSVDDEAGRLQFRPETNYVGDASLTVVLADKFGRVYEQRLNMKLVPVNDAPTVLGESMVSAEDVPLLIEGAMLLANDRDPEGDALTISGIGRVMLGKAELLANGMIHYNPPTDQYGVTDTVEYFVSDRYGASSVAKIRILLAPVEDAPSVVSERVINAHEDQVVRIAAPLLLANDFDTDTDARVGSTALRITGVGAAEHGEVRLDDGDIVFRPEHNYNGVAAFSYTVTDVSGRSTTGRSQIRIDPVTDAPLVADETIAATEDQPLIIDTALLLANEIDTDILRGEDQTLCVVAIDQIQGGTARLRDGQIMFTPEVNRVGPTGFRYTVSDGAGGLAQGNTVITLTPVNDAPIVPVMHGHTDEDQPLSIMLTDLLNNATDVDDDHASLCFAGIGKVTGGTVVLQNDRLLFTPERDYAGSATIEYRVADAQGLTTTGLYAVDVSGINDAPRQLDGVRLQPVADEDQEIRISESALLQCFIDPDGDPIRLLPESLRALASGDRVSFDEQRRELVFRAAPHANGERCVSFAVTDGALASQAATLKLQLRPVNDAPEVKPVGFQMLEDGGETDPTKSAWTYISHDLLLSEASDVDGDSLCITSVGSGKTLGSLRSLSIQVKNDPDKRQIRLLAPINYVGALEFEFTVEDGKGGQTTQKAIGSVQAVNDAPKMIIFIGSTQNTSWFNPNTQITSFKVMAWDPEFEQTTSLAIEKNPLIGKAALSNQSSFRCNDIFNPADRDTFGRLTRADLTSYSSRGSRASKQDVWIKATDSAGGSSISTFSFTAFYDPVIIDLDNDGLEFIDLDHSPVRFVTDDSGQARRIAWVGADDGILAYDVDGDGRINRFDEIAFGSHIDPQTPDISDLQALQHVEFDSNQDGVFDASDGKWQQFKLWRDLNRNGQSDAGELQTLQQAGLRQLYLNGNVLNRFEGPDALVRGYTRAVTDDGRLLQAADVWLNVDDGSRARAPAPAPLREAHAMETDQLAALLKQLADTPTGSNRAPLLYGYLPAQYADEGDFFQLDIAPNFFIDPDVGDILEFSATLADGSPLPEWLVFDFRRLRFEGIPTGVDAAQLQIVLRATDPQQASTETSFDLIVSPAYTLPEESVTLDNSIVPAQQNLSWNALLPMDDWLAATSAESLSEVGAWPDSPLFDQAAVSLQDTPVAAGAAMTAPKQTIAQLFQDFIQGTSGDDAYDFHPGDGWRSLQDPGGDDLIRIELDHAESTLQFERQGSDLSLSVAGTHDGLRIAGWYERNESGAAVHQIERFQLNDGRTLIASDLEPLIAAQSVTTNYSSSQFWR
ncbi:MAG: tandem-95 repeat protein [Oxalobacteraceae bacterium]|nr:tandem-95 repeat protein [Oxalobacteraceae bacterium]